MYNEKPDIRPRVIAFIGIFMLVFIVLLTRLWSMQIINGESYKKEAAQNSLREATTIAPRGRIFDCNGKVLVGNRSTMAVLAPTTIVNDTPLVLRLAKILGMTKQEVIDKATTKKEAALDLRVIAIDVPMKTVAYIEEHSTSFGGVEVQARAVRTYPNGSVAAHVLGYTGEISDTQLNSSTFKNYDPSDIVGKTGAESSFESVLQGVRGRRVLEVNAQGKIQTIVSETQPGSGQDIELTLDLKTQKVAEASLKKAIMRSRAAGNKAVAGSAVVMDVNTGAIVAMASYPTYNPEEFINGISTKTWKRFNSKSSSYPLTNRAIMSVYPPGSTFKAFTSLTGLNYGLINTATTFDCVGYWTGLGKTWGKWCWLHTGHGIQNLYSALINSCDTYFYNVGLRDYKTGKENQQKLARQFGFGKLTGIDLPSEAKGRVPDAKWKAAWNVNYPEYKKWLPGDSVNLAIGQGDLLVTPLQLVTAYSAIANGGTIYQPHVFKSALSSEGKTVITAKKKVTGKPSVSNSSVQTLQSNLRAVISQSASGPKLSNVGVPVSGKTGTAQKTEENDYAWFAAYAPSNNPKYAVVAMIEQGGGGGTYALPVVDDILVSLFK